MVLTYNDTGLSAGTTYNYRVEPRTWRVIVGPYSNVAIGTTCRPELSPCRLAFAQCVQGNQGISTITTTVSGGFNSPDQSVRRGRSGGTTVTSTQGQSLHRARAPRR